MPDPAGSIIGRTRTRSARREEVTATDSAAPAGGRPRRAWLIALRGAAALGFAALAFGWPRPTLAVAVLLFGVYALLDGLLAGVAAFSAFRGRERWWPAALQAFVGIAIGLGASSLLLIGDDARLLPYLVAVWAIANGALRVYAAFELRRYVGVEWATMGVGALFVVTGLLLIAVPDWGALAALWLVAAGALVYGVFTLLQAYRWHQLERRLAPPG